MITHEESRNRSGDTIADGKYRLDALLGSGSMGQVYRATHVALERTVAVKIMHADVMRRPKAVERFRREARAASQFRHPNSVQILDFGSDDGHLHYIVMEFLKGIRLDDIINDAAATGLTLPLIVDIMGQILGALGAAHSRGIIHRDIKPENILLIPGEDDAGHATLHVKVCDFGLAKLLKQDNVDASDDAESSDEEPLTAIGEVLGTPAFMSPEQARGQRLDARSDIYSCGVLLFLMATGELPFSGRTSASVLMLHVLHPPTRPTHVRPELDPRFEHIILQALAKAPDARQPDARTLRSQLRQLLPPSTYRLSSQAEIDPIPIIVDAEPTRAPSRQTLTGSPMAELLAGGHLDDIDAPPPQESTLATLLTALEHADTALWRLALAHLDDIIQQQLTEHLARTTRWRGPGDPRWTTFPQRIQALAHDEDLEPILERYRSALRSATRDTGADTRSSLLDAAHDLAQHLDALSAPPHSRLAEAPLRINGIILETTHGARYAELVHSHPVDLASDLLVVHTHTHALTAPPRGRMISRLKAYGSHPILDAPLLSAQSPHPLHACFEGLSGHTPARYLLGVRGAPPKGDDTSWFEHVIAHVFAAVSALEMLGHRLTRIVLPLDHLHLLRDPAAGLHATIHQAQRWLQRSEHTQRVILAAIFDDESEHWSSVMNTVLQRTTLLTAEDPTLHSLTHDIAQLLAPIESGHFSTSAAPLRALLVHPDAAICIEQICVFARTLALQIIARILDQDAHAVANTWREHLESLQRAGRLPSNTAAYIHTLCTLGIDTSTHLAWVDLVTVLSALRALLVYWADHDSDQKS